MKHFALHVTSVGILYGLFQQWAGAGTLKVAGQVAGIGGLALGVLLLVFREVIRKNVFAGLTKDNSYRLLRLVIILTWSVAVLGIVAWTYSVSLGAGAEKKEGGAEYKLSGMVKDSEGRGLPDVDVSTYGSMERDRTTSSGGFILVLRGERSESVRIRAFKQGYLPWEENVRVPDTNLAITLLPERPQEPARTAPTPANGSRGVAHQSHGTRPTQGREPTIVEQRTIKPSGDVQHD